MGGMIKCLECGVKLHSLYRHDFKQCECEQGSFIDGGFDYARYGGEDMDKVVFLVHEHTKDGEVI